MSNANDLKRITMDTVTKNIPELVAGTNITITEDPDDDGKKIISARGGGGGGGLEYTLKQTGLTNAGFFLEDSDSQNCGQINVVGEQGVTTELTSGGVKIKGLKYTADAPDVSTKTNNVRQNDVTDNVANGGYALAEGRKTYAYGFASHTEGNRTVAGDSTDATKGSYAHAEGQYSVASGTYAHAEGSSTDATGNASHAEGTDSLASGEHSHAEGYKTSATNIRTHAEGSDTTASGQTSHAEGKSTIASGNKSHAEGEESVSVGYCSHAEGRSTSTAGTYSHAQNLGTTAGRSATTALGTYNVEDNTVGTTHPSGQSIYGSYAVIVGNGTADDARNNALTVAWNGNVKSAGDIEDGSGNVLKNMQPKLTKAAILTLLGYEEATLAVTDTDGTTTTKTILVKS